MSKRLFVTFWATFEEGDLSNSFMGNCEIEFGDGETLDGMEDIMRIEQNIKDNLNTGADTDQKIWALTITNWRTF